MFGLLQTPELPVIKHDVKIKYKNNENEFFIGVEYVKNNSHFLILEFLDSVKYINIDNIDSFDMVQS